MNIDVDEVMEKFFEKVDFNGYILYDCKKCKEKGLRTKVATVTDAVFHLRKFHFEGGIYQYFEDVKKLYGQKVLREMTGGLR